LKDSGKIFFASDFHLGLKAGSDPLDREKKVVRWLNTIAPDAREIFLVGDIFDFWWEYKLVVPRGFTRFLGTVSAITDSGIPVHFFTGNHDMWVGNYLSGECGITIHTTPYTQTFGGKKFLIVHGEGLGSESTGYKILLAIFRNKTLRDLYSMLHPFIGLGIGHKWSLSSRLGKGITKEFLGEENEDLIKYSKSVLKNEHFDFFIFGHRHLPLLYDLKQDTTIVFLGDWINRGSFAEWDGKQINLREF
jgi:UDP-2,3-diacylglucosamine hydrolase